MYAQQLNSSDAPFFLVCGECGADSTSESHDQAVADGWSGIDYTLFLLTANFVGLCPECCERLGHWPTAEDHE